MRADKQQALLEGGLRVFARDGYSRASISALASEAGVSTRTIYNQYGNKESLFRAVILNSANLVAEREIGQANLLLGRVTDLRRDLIAFGIAWATPDPATRLHFAMVRQVGADAEHIDPDVLTAWRSAGPQRVRAVIVDHLQALADQGLLNLPDAELATLHLIALTADMVRAIGPDADVASVVGAGIDVFLAAYGR